MLKCFFSIYRDIEVGDLLFFVWCFSIFEDVLLLYEIIEMVCMFAIENGVLARCEVFFYRNEEVGVLGGEFILFLLVGILFLNDTFIIIIFNVVFGLILLILIMDCVGCGCKR